MSSTNDVRTGDVTLYFRAYSTFLYKINKKLRKNIYINNFVATSVFIFDWIFLILAGNKDHYVNVSVLIKFSQKTSVFTLIIISSP